MEFWNSRKNISSRAVTDSTISHHLSRCNLLLVTSATLSFQLLLFNVSVGMHHAQWSSNLVPINICGQKWCCKRLDDKNNTNNIFERFRYSTTIPRDEAFCTHDVAAPEMTGKETFSLVLVAPFCSVEGLSLVTFSLISLLLLDFWTPTTPGGLLIGACFGNTGSLSFACCWWRWRDSPFGFKTTPRLRNNLGIRLHSLSAVLCSLSVSPVERGAIRRLTCSLPIVNSLFGGKSLMLFSESVSTTGRKPAFWVWVDINGGWLASSFSASLTTPFFVDVSTS